MYKHVSRFHHKLRTQASLESSTRRSSKRRRRNRGHVQRNSHEINQRKAFRLLRLEQQVRRQDGKLTGRVISVDENTAGLQRVVIAWDDGDTTLYREEDPQALHTLHLHLPSV